MSLKVAETDSIGSWSFGDLKLSTLDERASAAAPTGDEGATAVAELQMKSRTA